MEDLNKKIAAVSVAPRITLDDIKDNIIEEHYFTAGEAVKTPLDQPCHTSMHLLTFCVLVLRNGFTVTGESACASPANFNAEIGRKVARENAVAKMWALMGYKLRSDLCGL